MPIFEKTPKQVEANLLLQGDARHVLFRGGARSGKTALMFRAMMLRAEKVGKSRHLILRKHFAQVKQSVWYDTMPFVMDSCFTGDKSAVRYDRSDWFVTLPNKSEIWFGGLDDKERTDKILGKEYSTIFFNEISEMAYESVGIAWTRLAQKNMLKKRCYYDCNPPKHGHWSEKLFIQHVDPLSDDNSPLENPEDFASIKVNPRDNAVNLDPSYIPQILEKLPPALRLRFLEGEYGSDDRDIVRPEWIVPSASLELGTVNAKFSFVDPAYTEEARATANTCESAVITVGITPDGLIHDIEVLHGMFSYHELKNVCKSVYLRHGKAKNYILGIEKVAAQVWLQEDLMREGIPCLAIPPDGDKVRRTISVTDLLEQGRCRINDRALSAQLIGFPGGKLKDLVDAYVGCLKLVKKYGEGLHVVKNEAFVPMSYEDRVHRYIRNKQERHRRARSGGGADSVLGRNW